MNFKSCLSKPNSNLKFTTDNVDRKKFQRSVVIKMKIRIIFVTFFLFFSSVASGFKLKHCADVLPSSRPVLCSNEKDYSKNEQPPDRPLHIQVRKSRAAALHSSHYVIRSLPSSSFSMHNLKNHQKIPCKREGKQTRPAILKSPILQSKNNRCVTCVSVCYKIT